MFLQLAWRNIWRNPRRTGVIMTAVVIGVWSMVLLGALMRGIADQMVKNGITTLTGHIQIHQKGYRSDPVIDNTVGDSQTLEAKVLEVVPSDSKWTSRVRVNAIASNARHSEGVTFVGIDPAREAQVSFLGYSVTMGRYLRPDDKNGILVGNALAEKFETRLGRKLVLMSQDRSGEIASRAFRIVGIFRAEMEATEKQFVFVTKAAAQQMLKLKNGISEIAVILADRGQVNSVAARLRAALSPVDYEIHTWQELLPLLTAYLDLYDGFIYLWFLVVFIAMGFGIVNTTLMAVFERIREFGLLKALGMKPRWIIINVLTESFLILLIGTVMGNVLGLASVIALTANGIDLSSFSAGAEFVGMSRAIFPVIYAKDMAMANVVVFVLGLLVSIYPAVKASRFTPVEAFAHI